MVPTCAIYRILHLGSTHNSLGQATLSRDRFHSVLWATRLTGQNIEANRTGGDAFHSALGSLTTSEWDHGSSGSHRDLSNWSSRHLTSLLNFSKNLWLERIKGKQHETEQCVRDCIQWDPYMHFDQLRKWVHDPWLQLYASQHTKWATKKEPEKLQIRK